MLSTNKMVLKWLCMIPFDKTSNKNHRVAFFLFALSGLTCKTFTAVAHVAFFVHYMHTDLHKSLFSLIGVMAISGAIYVGISGIILRHKIVIIYEQLSDIYDFGE